MIYIRQHLERGHAKSNWLDTWHTFSFADYYDPAFMAFSALRVINEDIIDASYGFPFHSHKNMEILTYVMQGTIEHKDSMGNTSQVKAGEFQIMSAGTGVEHSEYAIGDEAVHMYQIWITPKRQGLTPRYEQRRFDLSADRQHILSANAENNTLKIFQNVNLWRWQYQANQAEEISLNVSRKYWIQIVSGSFSLGKHKLIRGDGVAIMAESSLLLSADKAGEILLFDLPE